MKKLLFFLSIVIAKFGFTQCDKTGNLFGIPDEFVTNRYSPLSKIYGHPYTMFNKRDYPFDLKQDLAFIRLKIKQDLALRGVYFNMSRPEIG